MKNHPDIFTARLALVPVVRVVVYRIDIVPFMLVMRICDDAHKYFGDTFYVTVSVRYPVDTPGQMNPLKMRYVTKMFQIRLIFII